MFEDVNKTVVVQTIILLPVIFCLIWYVLTPLFQELFLKQVVNEEPAEVVFASDIYTLEGCKPCGRSSRSIQMNGNPSMRVRVCDKHAEPHRRKRLMSRIERQGNATIH